MSQILDSVEDCVEHTLQRVGKRVVLAAPLGLGKPVQLINAFYRRAAEDASLSLHIYTALSLERPPSGSGLESRLLAPVLDRVFADYEELAYMAPLRAGALPPNIQVSEFYFKAGAMKQVPEAQRHYISSNYTHAARDMVTQGANVVAQLVARRGDEVSLSCNPDTTRQLARLLDEAGRECLFLGQVHDDLPFMGRDAIAPPDLFDFVVDNRQYDRRLFSVPNARVPLADHATAIHAASLVVDGGTLQIGIGALGDAVADACILRQREPGAFGAMLDALGEGPASAGQHREGFTEGLYASTEMFVNGMLQLIEAGVIKRRVYDQLELQRGLNSGAITEQADARLLAFCRERGLLPRQLDEPALAQGQHWGWLPEALTLQGSDLRLGAQSLENDLDANQTREALLAALAGQSLHHGCVLHGGFFLGPADFYQRLRTLPDAVGESICMTGVERTNQLIENVPLYTAQRRRARFINTGMMVSLSGAVASDGLEDGTVISGVGGQYNFVAMAHELPGARSILCIRSTRGAGRELQSNIVPHYGHTTIPRHLRDIVVTEYGIADLRGQEDAEVIKRLLAVADSRFQEELRQHAVAVGKLEPDYRIPERYRHNTPARLRRALEPFQRQGLLADFPFGCELTEIEQALAAALKPLPATLRSPGGWWQLWRTGAGSAGEREVLAPYLERLGLAAPESSRERLLAWLVAAQLRRCGIGRGAGA